VVVVVVGALVVDVGLTGDPPPFESPEKLLERQDGTKRSNKQNNISLIIDKCWSAFFIETLLSCLDCAPLSADHAHFFNLTG
jgi:hypothetical protein